MEGQGEGGSGKQRERQTELQCVRRMNEGRHGLRERQREGGIN